MPCLRPAITRWRAHLQVALLMAVITYMRLSRGRVGFAGCASLELMKKKRSCLLLAQLPGSGPTLQRSTSWSRPLLHSPAKLEEWQKKIEINKRIKTETSMQSKSEIDASQE